MLPKGSCLPLPLVESIQKVSTKEEEEEEEEEESVFCLLDPRPQYSPRPCQHNAYLFEVTNDRDLLIH